MMLMSRRDSKGNNTKQKTARQNTKIKTKTTRMKKNKTKHDARTAVTGGETALVISCGGVSTAVDKIRDSCHRWM